MSITHIKLKIFWSVQLHATNFQAVSLAHSAILQRFFFTSKKIPTVYFWFVNIPKILLQLAPSLQLISQSQWKAGHPRKPKATKKSNWIDIIRIKFPNSLKLKGSICALITEKLLLHCLLLHGWHGRSFARFFNSVSCFITLRREPKVVIGEYSQAIRATRTHELWSMDYVTKFYQAYKKTSL